MKVNIKQVPAGGKPYKVTGKLDLSQLKRWGGYPIPSPADVNAEFRNRNGVVSMAYTVDYTLESSCTRCLEPMSLPGRLEMEHILVEEVEDEKNDAFILVPDAMLDLLELVWADVSLSLDDVLLCREDCEGLCPVCGGNRNQSPCGCDARETEKPLGPLGILMAEQQS